ncbi:DUF4271 domain-containing protein [Marinifilum sp.]|uniref:DUF4271 domain-containing protein n=1 Tax=Marinifilum sp. TaxID=2033137 RepID=UPI003BAC18B3
MAFINSSVSPVHKTVFQDSTPQVNFRQQRLNKGKVISDKTALNQQGVKLANDYELKTLLASADSVRTDTIFLNLIPTPEYINAEYSVRDNNIERPLIKDGRLIEKNQSDWMSAVGILILILMAIIRFSFNKYLHRLIDSILNYQVSNTLFLEKNMRNRRGGIFLNGLFFVNFSFFAVLYYNYIHTGIDQESSILRFFSVLTGLSLIYFGKLIVVRTIAYIFDGVKEGKEYLYNVFIYNKNLGIFLSPITLSVPFVVEFAAHFLLHAGLILTLIFYLLRLFRGIKILFRKHVSIFYMILYLCALEILPLLVIYKLLISLV